MDTSIVAALQMSPLGADCSRAELIALAQRMERVDLSPQAFLFHAQDSADAAFVVLAGELEILSADGTFLDRIGPGTLVGEQALLPDGGGARNAGVRALDACRLLRVDAETFVQMAQQEGERRDRLEADSLARTLNRLSRTKGPLGRLLEVSERRAFCEGDVLFEEGDPADGLYLVLAGRAEVVSDRQGEPVHLCTVYPGSVFGERATLHGEPRAASVIARAGLTTAFVGLEAAQALHREAPDLEAFLASLLRSYELPTTGTVHQRSVRVAGETCIETLYTLDDGRELRALRTPSGRFTFQVADAVVAKELTVAPGTTVRLDAEHRIVGLEDGGEYEDLASLQGLALERRALSVPQRRTLRRAAREAAQRAPDALICNCLKLERAALECAIQEGARTPEALRQATGCGSVCGGCMRKSVPAIFAQLGASPAAPAPAPMVPTAVTLPRMPKLIPWLGNFSLSRDPAGFQRRGHERLGPVFGAHLMGLDFVFIDPVAEPALLSRTLERSDLDGPQAWRTLSGRLLGEPLVSSRPDLQLHALPEASVQAIERAIEAREEGGDGDLQTLAQRSVTSALLPLCDLPTSEDTLAEIDGLLGQIGSDFTAIGALMPVETPAARRRIQACAALQERVGLEAQALLVASHRNASLAVVAALVELAQHPEILAALQAEGPAPRSVGELSERPLLAGVLREAARLHGGGALWRQAPQDIDLDGTPVPAGALVGAVLRLSNQAAGPFDPAQGRAPGGAPSTALFDEGFGRLQGQRVPEAVALLVLSRLLSLDGLAGVSAPRRWETPIVPGMSRPVGPIRVA